MKKKIEILKHDTNFCPKDIQGGLPYASPSEVPKASVLIPPLGKKDLPIFSVFPVRRNL
jgi:hypothetical protein